MRILLLFLWTAGFAIALGAEAQQPNVPESTLRKAFQGRHGAFVLIDCASGKSFQSDPAACAEKVAPFSTFKIWNSAIGLETGLVQDPDAPFWAWDGQKRWLEAWNKDQTLRSAMAASCVPAYQALARQIGPERMQKWLDLIGYGDRDITAGIDIFWLDPPDHKPLLITPTQQARLIAKLVNGEVPFSNKTRTALKSIMTLKTTDHGILYGKTGSGERDGSAWGWFVGYVESAGKTFAFACLLKDQDVTGKDARKATERILGDAKLL